jgi:hypothetical protein
VTLPAEILAYTAAMGFAVLAILWLIGKFGAAR